MEVGEVLEGRFRLAAREEPRAGRPHEGLLVFVGEDLLTGRPVSVLAPDRKALLAPGVRASWQAGEREPDAARAGEADPPASARLPCLYVGDHQGRPFRVYPWSAPWPEDAAPAPEAGLPLARWLAAAVLDLAEAEESAAIVEPRLDARGRPRLLALPSLRAPPAHLRPPLPALADSLSTRLLGLPPRAASAPPREHARLRPDLPSELRALLDALQREDAPAARALLGAAPPPPPPPLSRPHADATSPQRPASTTHLPSPPPDPEGPAWWIRSTPRTEAARRRLAALLDLPLAALEAPPADGWVLPVPPDAPLPEPALLGLEAEVLGPVDAWASARTWGALAGAASLLVVALAGLVLGVLGGLLFFALGALAGLAALALGGLTLRAQTRTLSASARRLALTRQGRLRRERGREEPTSRQELRALHREVLQADLPAPLRLDLEEAIRRLDLDLPTRSEEEALARVEQLREGARATWARLHAEAIGTLDAPATRTARRSGQPADP